MTILHFALAAFVALGFPTAAAASGPAPAAPPAGDSTPPAGDACCTLAAGTQVELEITEAILSWQRKRGDRFGLRVIAPVIVDGNVVVPVDTLAIGEVVHAAAARGGGAPGELLIAIRSLDVAGRAVPMRGLKLAHTGQDNTALAVGMSMAIGPFAMFIRGREIEIPPSTPVVAKVAAETLLPQVSTAVPTTTPTME